MVWVRDVVVLEDNANEICRRVNNSIMYSSRFQALPHKGNQVLSEVWDHIQVKSSCFFVWGMEGNPITIHGICPLRETCSEKYVGISCDPECWQICEGNKV